MAEKREIITCSVFDARAVFTSRLWEPETTDFKSGKPLDKPRYSVSVITPKTRERWFDEPVLASVVEASRKLYTQHFSGWPIENLIWPVKDGDKPNEKGLVPDWSKGHWVIRADSTAPQYLTIEAVQNGKPIELPASKIGGRVVVKDGDHCILTVGIAKSEGSAPGLKTYLNGILFTKSGEAITLGSRVSSDELLRQAQAQGLQVSGVGAPTAGGGFGGTPQGVRESNPFAPAGAAQGSSGQAPF